MARRGCVNVVVIVVESDVRMDCVATFPMKYFAGFRSRCTVRMNVAMQCDAVMCVTEGILLFKLLRMCMWQSKSDVM